MKRLLSVLLWSILAAAFIGPGTVTAAAAAGSGFGYRLLWALVFSTVACIVLQEACARLTVASGLDLGQALRRRWGRGAAGVLVPGLVVAAVVLGCAAYEAGNILGAVAGAALVVELPAAPLTAACGLAAGLLLWFNRPQRVARLLSLLVAAMGIAFLSAAWGLRPELGALLRGGLLPSLPPGSAMLGLALVGTTVVPYNLFLGSGLARGESLAETRFGLVIAVGLGGLISAGVLVVGTAVAAPFDLAALMDVLERRLGEGGGPLFAAGLLAAGFSSAVTAPLAAALTARSLYARDAGDVRWQEQSWRYRGVWMLVLAAGVGFGASGVRPVPAIVAAQALNGVLLPLVAVFLLLAVNDRRLLGADANGWLANLVMAPVVAVTLLLGASGCLRAVASAIGRPPPGATAVVTLAAAVALPAAAAAWRLRRG